MSVFSHPAFIGIGTYIFVRTGIIWASYEKLSAGRRLFQVKKEKQSVTSAISLTYWLIAIAIYLGYGVLVQTAGNQPNAMGYRRSTLSCSFRNYKCMVVEEIVNFKLQF